MAKMSKTDQRIATLTKAYGAEYALLYVQLRKTIAHMEGAADYGGAPADKGIVDCDLDIVAARI